MIFITSEKPLFRAYVNGVIDIKTQSGGVIKKIKLGTSEKKQDETREYSNWFAVLNGKARQKNEQNPLKDGDCIEIYSFKQTNVSKKMDNGEWSKPFFNIAIMDYEIFGENKNTEQTQNEDENPF